MSVADKVVEDYNKSADTYDDIDSLPTRVLEAQLVKMALGDATGLLVLDVGGGTGSHARAAIDAGAQRVDVVDITTEMLRIGRDIETSMGREDRIRYLEADVSKPLDSLALGTYDIVMANWVFDHAGTIAVLEGMWSNIVAHLKPGGVFFGVRVADLNSPAILETTKYGASFKNLKPIPGGMAYTCVMHSNPPFEFEACSMEISFSGSYELHEKFGLTDLEVVPYEESEVVKKDPAFWAMFIENPNFAVVRGKKKVE